MALTDAAAADRVARLIARLLHFQGQARQADTISAKRAADQAASLATQQTTGPDCVQAGVN